MTSSSRQRLVVLFSCVAAMGLSACGGSSDSTVAATPTPSPSPSPSPSPAPAATVVSGAAVKGPVANATVTIKNATTGATLATGGTSADGTYSLSVPAASGDVIIEITGGSYVDEATGLTTSLTTPLRNVVTVNGGTVQGYVTPLTTLAYTYAFGNVTTGVTASAYGVKATSIAAQFQVPNLNTLPVVTGSTNTYGQVLRGLSQYLATNAITLQTFTSTTFTAQQWTSFTSLFNAAYKTSNPAGTLTFNFDGSGLAVGGTGAGGGSGTCGVAVSGTVAAGGISVPLNLNFCISGIAAGSCTSGNASLSQAIAGQGGIAGAANLQYTYSPTCAAGATTVTLQ
ncbi:MAG: hypothetical protein KF796_03270 [Ramlibacter sp.]|nr:hypothetical protein [Ramlibacter sp.]